MITPLLFTVATFIGGGQVPPPPVPVAVVAPAPAPVEAAAPAAAPTLPASGRAGHYDCTGADNDSADCVRDEAQPELPAHGDAPGQTLGSTDADYGADLTRQLCDIKPWFC